MLLLLSFRLSADSLSPQTPHSQSLDSLPLFQHWLDPTKRVDRQIRSTSPVTLYLGVKFYAADPCRLIEEITRYHFFLQVSQSVTQWKRNKSDPQLQPICNFATPSLERMFIILFIFLPKYLNLYCSAFRSSSMCYKAACLLLRISPWS